MTTLFDTDAFPGGCYATRGDALNACRRYLERESDRPITIEELNLSELYDTTAVPAWVHIDWQRVLWHNHNDDAIVFHHRRRGSEGFWSFDVVDDMEQSDFHNIFDYTDYDDVIICSPRTPNLTAPPPPDDDPSTTAPNLTAPLEPLLDPSNNDVFPCEPR
jgi:hypothetical protein